MARLPWDDLSLEIHPPSISNIRKRCQFVTVRMSKDHRLEREQELGPASETFDLWRDLGIDPEPPLVVPVAPARGVGERWPGILAQMDFT